MQIGVIDLSAIGNSSCGLVFASDIIVQLII
jgi:hypothetical protein